MDACTMTEDETTEVEQLQEKIKFLKATAKDAFFAGFELSKFFPSDSDISKKWDEYRDSVGLKNDA